MQHKLFLYGIITLTILGSLTAYVLQPSRIEEAYILYQDKFYAEARQAYEKLWNEGNRSMSVTIPYSELLLLEGRVSDAVGIMEEFIKFSVKSVGAREHLGKLYQYDQRPDAYLVNLEAIYHMEPSANILRELSRIYNYYGEYDKQLKILQELLISFEAEEEDIRQIAYLYAGQSKFDLAAEAFDNFFRKHPERLSLSGARLYLSILLDLRQKEKALAMSQSFVSQFPDARENNASELGKVLLERNAEQEALALLLPLKDKAQKHDKLFAVLIEAKVANKLHEEAFSELQERFDNKDLPPAALENFIALAQKMGSWALQKILIEQVNTQDLPEHLIIGYGPGLIENESKQSVAKISQDLGRDYINVHDQVNLVINLANNRTPPNSLIARLTRNKKLLVRDKLLLATLLNGKGLKRHASKILLSISTKSDFEDTELFDLANLFMDLSYPQRGMKFFESIQKNPDYIRDREQLNYAWALLAAASGKEQAVLDWLYSESDENKDIRLLKDIYFVSYRFRHPSLVLRFASDLYRRLPDDENSQYLADAYLMSDKFSEAVPLLEDLNKRGKDVLDTYIFAVHRAALKQPKEYREKLKGLLDVELSKEDIADDKKREYAFMLYENAFRAEATTLFFELAKEAKPNHPDVEQLVFIFGRAPPEWGLSWVKDRLSNSFGRGKHNWLGHLLDMNQISFVISVYETDKRLQKTDLVYLQSLYEVKRKGDIKSLLRDSLQVHDKPDDLAVVGDLAFYVEDQPLALEAFEKILLKNPNHPDALKQAGLLLFDAGDVARAKKYLLKLDKIKPKDYLVQYQLGQIFYREGDSSQAKNHFQKTHKEIILFKEKPSDVYRLAPLVLAYLGKFQAASSAYDELLSHRADDYHAQADVLDVLIDDKQFDLAISLSKKSLATAASLNKNKKKRGAALSMGYDRVLDKPARIYFAQKKHDEAYAEAKRL